MPVCTCVQGYRGSPLAGCRHECENDSECPQHLACSSSFRCESPCKCGENAECQVVNHQGKCTCPKVSTPPCLSFHERKRSTSLTKRLDDEKKIPCAINLLFFFLFQTWVGNPYVSCRPECTAHSECSAAKPACLYQKCVNPCDGVCGVNADCNLRDITPVCSCPRHMTGNPFVSCRLFEPRKQSAIVKCCV